MGGPLHMRTRMMASEEDVTDSAGRLCRHPSAVGNYEGGGEGGGLSMQSAGGQSGGSPKSGKFGKLHRL